MTRDDARALARWCDEVIEIECHDGETLVADLVYLSVAGEEVLFDLVETNRPERYADRWIGFHVYSLPFAAIKTFTPDSAPASRRALAHKPG